jgi:hypothetical protein
MEKMLSPSHLLETLEGANLVADEKTTSYGSCSFERVNPSREDLSSATPKLNLFVSFEEALKLNLAIQERLRAINKLKRNSKKGKRAALNLVVDLNVNNIAVMPGQLAERG